MDVVPSHALPDRDAQHAAELKAASRVTLVGMLLDAALGLFKCIVGVLFHSQALVVDGVHSFSDVFSDLVVLGIMKAARRGPDQCHPYGHQRYETLGTMLLGSTLIAVAAILAWDNVSRLAHPQSLELPEWPVLAIALISVGSKEWIYHYTRRVGLAIRSDLIVANAWHSRTDAFSSVIVVFSTIGAMLGFIWLDALAAVAVALIVGWVGWKFTWDSVKELVDTGLSEAEITELTAIAETTEGVHSVHTLRSRRMSQDILLDVHIQVDSDISVSEGHQIGQHVVVRMREQCPDISLISIHIDAEDDESSRPTSVRLPNRSEIEGRIEHHLGTRLPSKRLSLHYLDNRVDLELFLETPFERDKRAQIALMEQAFAAESWFGSLLVWVPPHTDQTSADD
ncbi:cation diffusion facilitator family transporter [Marinobacter sp. X15-166B]|uniref:cation diffusion facilitator family transporter n=1 Tax=Marinobacter sp. X15-166B TaxID=1897620 RepID=UPI00085BF8FE|nr:cation diffusion facilitator family transporter [Marinobacter sp. X15-166B]OEY67277.1 cation transporter [Marinobacter sp. X15-166B]